ncbi:MAG: UDP-N-acetylmuramate dehydrogenase [Erysipelotrichales bacterium]|nr:UDP-N-acetylmuramate dehydrogenase [Erysipelotrichales bacterium]
MMKIETRHKEPLKEYTTLHIGGYCHNLYFPKSEKEIRYLLDTYDPIILGRGSNVLINDTVEYDHVMILTEYKGIYLQGDVIIAESGARLMDVCLFALEHSLTGLEFAYGIPGSVGGAVIMNAGAYGGEVKDVLIQVDTTEGSYSNEDCCFEYRKSRFSDTKECILRGYFKVQKGNKEEIQAKMQDLITRRREKQPLDKYSAGSTFKRGKDFYASATISECGLKGYAVNDAMVSTKHAGFLINEGNASYTEFLALIHDVKRIVFEKTGRVLETEVKIIE